MPTKFIIVTILLLSISSCTKSNSSTRQHTDTTNIAQSNIKADIKQSADTMITRYEGSNCSTFVKLPNGNTIFIEEYPTTPIYHKLTNKLSSVIVSCGSPCNYTTYIDMKNGTKSIPYFLVCAVDTENNIVAYCDSSEIIVSSIFNPAQATIKIQREFAPSATVFTTIDSAYFRADNFFAFQYSAGNEFLTKRDSVLISFKQ